MTLEEHLTKLKLCVGVVEANSFELLQLWSQTSEESLNRYPKAKVRKWEQDTSSPLIKFGKIDQRPCCGYFSINKIDGQFVAFFNATSEVFDWKLYKQWVSENIPENVIHCDAMNFHICLNHIDELNRN